MNKAHLIAFSGIVSVFLGVSAFAADVTAATAAAPLCKDGTTATHTGKGACSHHGGVNKAGAASTTTSAKSTAPAASTETPTSSKKTSAATAKSTSSGSVDANGATAKCKDGTFSHSKHHSGSCSHHGGVAEFLTP